MENDLEKTEEVATRLYNKTQVYLIKYMLLKGIIEKPEDYVENGYAEVFNMLASGAISVPQKIDWQAIRGKVKKVTGI